MEYIAHGTRHTRFTVVDAIGWREFHAYSSPFIVTRVTLSMARSSWTYGTGKEDFRSMAFDRFCSKDERKQYI